MIRLKSHFLQHGAMAKDMMFGSSDKFCLFYLCIILIHCVNGNIIDEFRIHGRCDLECDHNLETDRDNFYCDQDCQVEQCQTGCLLYREAVTSQTCQSVCSDYLFQNITDTGPEGSGSQVKKQYCIEGCIFGLNGYYKELVPYHGMKLPAPQVVKHSITHNSVVLSLEGAIPDNVTYHVQRRVVDTRTDWQIHNETVEIDGNVSITSLHPYLTYKFKILFKVTSMHVLETDESASISTLPYGVPTSSPTIVTIDAPSSSVISVSWQPPTYANGPIVSYHLTLHPVDSVHRETNDDVPQEVTSYMFGQLDAGVTYQVSVSAYNEAGEGPSHVKVVQTPNQVSEDDEPGLIFGADNMVVRQSLLELTREAERVLVKPRSILVTEGATILFESNTTSDLVQGVGVSVRDQLVLVADDSGQVTLLSLESDEKADNIYPTLIEPSAIDVDWLHHKAYVVDGQRIYQCSIQMADNHCRVVLDMYQYRPRQIKVDPVNGFLYFTVINTKNGLYKIDLGHLGSSDDTATLLIDSDLQTFFIDHDHLRLYFPNDNINTMMSAFLDGTGITDIRKGSVARPNFLNISSMIQYDDKFFWTNGTHVFSELYDAGNRTYYHNYMLLFEKHFCGFNMFSPHAQPIPSPFHPPAKVQALFTAYKAIIQWDVPKKLQFQGDGAYNSWDYEVNVLQADGSHNELHQTNRDMILVVANLQPDTQYQVKVRAKSSAGTGPWSQVFYGRTLQDELDSARLIVAIQHQYKMWQISEVGLDGQDPRILTETSPLYTGVTDLAWYGDKLFWTSEGGDLFMHRDNAIELETMPLDFVMDAASIAFDWLGERIYWSVYKNGVIKRADMYGQSVDFVYQALARDMTIDSVQGRLYWVTMNSMETTFLDGSDHLEYFSVPYFSGIQLISLSINFDLHKIMWYVKTFEEQALYSADLMGYGHDNDIRQSVKLIGNFQDISKFSVIQYFSHRLLWLDNDLSVIVGDTDCNYTSNITALGSGVTMFALRHPSLQPHPEGLNSSTTIVVPAAIPAASIRCQGSWSHFNVTWQPSTEVNHGKVAYELSLHAQYMVNTVLVTEEPWYEVTGLPPYSPLTVTIRGYTYWGSGALTLTTVRSPMSVPTQPLAPKVYVTQRKNAASSKVTLAADFRWTAPETTNGIMSHQHVYYWQSASPDQISSTTLAPSTRHFILNDLKRNTTYYFQIESCTPVGCGPRSDVANATADAVNPVPMLAIATNTGIRIAEADSIVNTSRPLVDRFVVAMTYLVQDNMKLWITGDGNVERYASGKTKQLHHLAGKGIDLSVDWISRTLYIVESNQSTTNIVSYQLDQSEHSIFVRRDGRIGNVVVDPYTSLLLWSEADPHTGTWTMYSCRTNGSNVQRIFSAHRQRRAVNNVCNCPASPVIWSVLAMDLSQDGRTEVVYVDPTNLRVMAADVQGCRCRTLFQANEADPKGLPPDLLTVDHIHIYWYNQVDQILYALDKVAGTLALTPLPDVTDILAFGSHLQPLPGSDCLDITPYTDTVGIVSYTNTTATVVLDAVQWPSECANISHPADRYTVYYRELDDMNPDDDCRPSGRYCHTKLSYKQQIQLTELDPYTYYVIQGAVSNHYNEYSATSLGEPLTVRTKPGVPSAVGNITAEAQSPNDILVIWPPPIQPNGPLDKIVYYVKWSSKSPDGSTKVEMTDAITYEASDPYNYGLFTVNISKWSPAHTYIIQVLCNQTLGGYMVESQPVKVHTFEEPEDIELIGATNTSIQLSWRSPSDDSTRMVSVYYAEVTSQPLMFMSNNAELPIMTDNYTLYNETFVDLRPNTEYAFRLNIIYKVAFKVYHWPVDGSDMKYVFNTLTGIPDPMDPPVTEEIKSGEFEVSWQPPNDNGEPITHYILQYRQLDKENWSLAHNTSDMRWVLDDHVLQRGFTYVFRVKALNKNGWGLDSMNSSFFSYPILEAESDDSMMTVVAVVCAVVFIIVAMAVIALCFTVCRRNSEDRKKKREFIAVALGPDLELATLRELPMGAVQQNALYAINMVPTDDDIAALPHFHRNQLVLCKFLGSGAFGEVFEGVAKNIINESSGDTKVAVKTLRKSANDQEKEEFLKEALLMSNFRHEHILSLLGVCLDNDPQFIILELMEGSDLLSFMRACRLSSIQNRSELSLTDLVKICVHVARGCKYLEDMHFVHRDLAARNCLVSSCNPSEMVVKIGDFGLARDIYKNDYYRKEGEGLLPVRWMSPESLVDGVFTTQSDIWAFGVLMWEVVTFGQQPYPARTNIEVLHYVRSSGRLDRPDNCPDDFYQLMCKCWNFAPEDRPSFAYLLKQLERFQETCASISEYLVPIRSSNTPVAAVDGYKYLTQRRPRMRSTSSDGPEYTGIHHTGYGRHTSYGQIRRATSFDTPEPKDATQQVHTDSANYLKPRSRTQPKYIEFLPESQTKNYIYNSKGERVKDKDETSPLETHSLPRGPSYVYTTVRENPEPTNTDYSKCRRLNSTPSKGPENTVTFTHQTNSTSSATRKPIQCKNQPNSNTADSSNTIDTDAVFKPINVAPNDALYAQVSPKEPSRNFRQYRLDSGHSCMSFDSNQTEPVYSSDHQNHRNVLYSSSSSKSNYSMSNTSDQVPELPVFTEEPVHEDQGDFWANNSSQMTNVKGHPEVRGHTELLNINAHSQVYPESAGALAGYDIVQASLV